MHRLDKDTSGALIVAKNDFSHVFLSNQIKNHEVEKTYIALVKGVIKENEKQILLPIGRSTKDRKKMAVVSNGKEAITFFKVLARYDKYTLLSINIKTGRTHQIRVHLSYLGFPIVGDIVYSSGKNEFGISGQMLHAKRICFNHPRTNERIEIEAPIPSYFEEILNKLETRKRD